MVAENKASYQRGDLRLLIMSAISVEGFGSVTWWGFTPALDLTSIAKDGTEMDVCPP